MAIKKSISIQGLSVRVKLPGKNDKPGQTVMRKFVSPEFVALWFHILDNQWDSELWARLNQHDQEFLAYCVRQAQIYHPEFEKALAKSFTRVHERLKLVEESIKAGNLSQALVDEFDGILNRLVSSGQMNSIHKTKLKKRLIRTLERVSQN
jgi:predicted RNA-binding protein